MFDSKPRLYFLTLLLIVAFILSFLILRPFLYALILALVFSIVCRPWYEAIRSRVPKSPSLASLLTILSIIIFLFIPLTLLGWQIFQEVQYFSNNVDIGNGQQFVNTLLANLNSRLDQYFPGFGGLFLDLDSYLKSLFNFLANNLSSLFFNAAKIITSLFVFFVASFFLLRDGKYLKSFIIKNSPLTKKDDELIISKISDSVNSVIRGNLTIALIQGIVSCLGFIIFGVPSPILWGTLAALGALVPGLGTSLVLVPAVLYLYFTGPLLPAVGLAIWGALAVGLIDNFLGPIVIGKKAKLHPLLTLLSVLGGLSFFGPIGFILGPLTVSLLLVLVDIYSTIVTKAEA